MTAAPQGKKKLNLPFAPHSDQHSAPTAAMEVLELTTTVNASGRLCLDIPTRLAPGEVQVVLVLNPAAGPR